MQSLLTKYRYRVPHTVRLLGVYDTSGQLNVPLWFLGDAAFSFDVFLLILF